LSRKKARDAVRAFVSPGTSVFFHPWKNTTPKKFALDILSLQICLRRRRDERPARAARLLWRRLLVADF